jgi:iron complex outermembrane receptor protein
MFSTPRLLLCSVSATAVAFATPAFAQTPPGEVTPGEAQQCADLPTPEQQQLCIQGQAGPEGTPEEAGELATLPPPEVAEQAAESETIVVTGSRIRRSEFTSPDPIQVINPELGAQEGKLQTVDLINTTPIAAGSVQITSAISTNFVTNGGEGAQTVSLRGLGAERTLVLLNGRRAGPAGVRGAVTSFDLNTIPSSIVNSIEILKTGASSIYGSDAIAGVVNILTKRQTDGIEIGGFASVPFHGGGEAMNLNATYGKEFERGHFLVALDYYKQEDLERKDRGFLDCAEEYLEFKNGGRADIVDIRTGRPACNGVLHNSILTNNDFTEFFTPDGQPLLVDPVSGRQLFVTQYQVGTELQDAGCIQLASIPGISAPANAYGCNFSGPTTGVLNQYSQLERGTDVISDLKRFTAYAQGSLEVGENAELYTELLFNNRKTKTDGISQLSSLQFTGNSFLPFFFCDDTVFNCSPFDAGDPLNTQWAGDFLLLPLILTDADSGTDIDYYRGVLGARGNLGLFGNSWSWDVYGQYSRSDGDYFQDYTRADAIFTQDLRTASCVGMVTPVSGVPCMDIDFTDPRVLAGNFTAEERAFLFDRDFGNTVYTQATGEAVLTGDVINLPAGAVSVALGGDIRRDEINDTPGEGSLNDNRYNLTSAGITAGSTVTKELFGEIQIPVLRDAPAFRSLTLSAAGRLTRVTAERRDGEEDKFGDETWKVGADWAVTNWLRFRGSWGTSFRAPALFELFLENQTGFGRQQDLDVCSDRERKLEQGIITQNIFDNCTAAGIPVDFEAATGGVTIVGGGGLGNLEPETSEAKVFSVILTPSFAFLPETRFSLAVDYFDIDVRDEISTLGASNIIVGCYNSDNFSSEQLCNLITRVPVGQPGEFNLTNIEDTYININSQQNRGIDVTGQVVQNLGNFGRLSLLAQMTWQLEDTLELFEGTEVELNGTVGDPKWVGNFHLSWTKGPWTAIYGLDVIGSADNRRELIEDQGAPCRTSVFRPGGEFCPDVSVPAVAYHAISLTRDIGDKYRFTLGVANLLDTKPPRVSTVFNGGISTLGQVPVFGSQYDYLGRRIFMNVRAKF